MHITLPFIWTRNGFGAKLLLAVILGIAVSLLAASRVVSAGTGTCSTAAVNATDETKSILPFSYIQTVPNTSVSVYAQTTDLDLGTPPVAIYPAGFVWFSLADTQPVCDNGQSWFKVNPQGYVPAANVINFQPSQFQGKILAGALDKPIAWLVYKTRPSNAPGNKPGPNTARLPQYTSITIYEEQPVGNLRWYRVGDNQWIEQRQMGVVKPSPRPFGINADEKWIEVNLYEQTLAAYEGDRIVYATLVSSGLPYWPTPTGLFRIWLKQEDGKMSGREGLPDFYYLQDVPWIMYFNKSVALHGAYWHDRFGEAHSHGCVNLTPLDAQWLFNWATPTGWGNWSLAMSDNPGTWVWIHGQAAGPVSKQ